MKKRAAKKKLEQLGLVVRDVMSMDMKMDAAKAGGGECPSATLHEEGLEGLRAYDDVSGQELNPELMIKARRDEIQYFRQMGVYERY